MIYQSNMLDRVIPWLSHFRDRDWSRLPYNLLGSNGPAECAEVKTNRVAPNDE